MTTIEHSFTQTQQPKAERDALFPTSVYSEPEEVDTDGFPSHIIPGSDKVEVNTQPEQDPHDAQVEAFLEQDKSDFHGLLELRLKGELVAQLFKKHPKEVAKGSVNLADMQSIVRTHIKQAQDSYAQQASYIDNVTIPEARTRFETPVSTTPGVIYYLNKDIPQLEAREDSYLAMGPYLDEFEPKNEDDYLSLTEAYVKRLLPEARQEAIDILQQKIDEREAKVRAAELEISQLEKTVEVLAQERDEAKAEVAQRDLQMHDTEMEAHLSEIEHLTREARALAA